LRSYQNYRDDQCKLRNVAKHGVTNGHDQKDLEEFGQPN
jgi:hypothetical protein